MDLWCVTVATTSECADAVNAAMERAGLSATAIEDAHDVLELRARAKYGEWFDADAPPPGAARVTAYAARPLADRDELLARVRQELQAVRECGLDAGSLAVSLDVLAEDDYLYAWKEHYHAFEVSPRLTVVPSWEFAEWSGGPGQIPLVMDPGVAFGTGLHETTLLCLRALERLAPDRAVLDVGTGTGILAIAAALLGARKVVALDLDPVAVDVARDNIAQNGVADAVTVLLSDLMEAVEGMDKFNIVVANLLAGLVQRLLPAASRALAPGGKLLASGLVQSQAAEVTESLRLHGFGEIAQERMGDWVLLSAVRSGDM